jgi:hypothetical protein
MQNLKPFWIISIILLLGCNKYVASNFDFPDPTETSDQPVIFQKKKTYHSAGVFADNQFDGARMNDFTQLDDSTFAVKITPENYPINPSPWYAFRIWSDSIRKIKLILDYEKANHRYWPKVSKDGNQWAHLDTASIYPLDNQDMILELWLSQDTLWVAGQEVINSQKIKNWCQNIAQHPEVSFSTIGQSKLGRDMYFLDMGSGNQKGKDVVVILSRQHPPEVTGYLAMEAFVETLLSDTKMARDFRKKYRMLVFPLMNPDGVDLGHWRHNAGGIDLNRDWAYYRQPETRLVADFIVKQAKKQKSEVVLGLDFHSTQKDLYYTFDSTFNTTMYGFHDYWIDNLGDNLDNYEPDHRPGKLNQPISKGWFLKQFDAESITYEVGDNTPREFIRLKAETAAVEMMKLMILR